MQRTAPTLDDTAASADPEQVGLSRISFERKRFGTRPLDLKVTIDRRGTLHFWGREGTAFLGHAERTIDARQFALLGQLIQDIELLSMPPKNEAAVSDANCDRFEVVIGRTPTVVTNRWVGSRKRALMPDHPANDIHERLDRLANSILAHVSELR
jgi:hypothetical protein